MQAPITTNEARRMIKDDLEIVTDPGLYYVRKLFIEDELQATPRSETRYWIPRTNYQALIEELKRKKNQSNDSLAAPYASN